LTTFSILISISFQFGDFYSENNSGLLDWIQAIAAMIAAIGVVVTLTRLSSDNKNTKEQLSHLAQLAKESDKRLKSMARAKQPIFELLAFTPTANVHTIKLRNKGATAFDFSGEVLKANLPHFLQIDPASSIIPNNATTNLLFNRTGQNQIQMIDYEIRITFSDEFSNSYYQVLHDVQHPSHSIVVNDPMEKI
jgi:hypothetical protein